MHASLAARFCLRCASRKTALKLARFSLRPMPQFCMKFLLSIALGWTVLLLIQDAAEVFGWKRLFIFAQAIIKQVRQNGGNNDGKKVENVSRSGVR